MDYIAKRKEEEKDARIVSILSAAGKLFLKRGYWSTTVRDIAREARLSTGALYFYFKNKDVIFTRIMEVLYHEFLDGIDNLIRKSVDDSDLFYQSITFLLDFIKNEPEKYEFLHSNQYYKYYDLCEENTLKIQSLEKKTNSVLGTITTNFLRLKNPGLQANDVQDLNTILWAGLFGLLDKSIIYEFEDLDFLINKWIKHFLNGIE